MHSEAPVRARRSAARAVRRILLQASLGLAALSLAEPGKRGSEPPRADLYVSVDDSTAELSLDGIPRPGRRQFPFEGIEAGRHRLVARARHRIGTLEVVLRRDEVRHVTLRMREATTRVRFLSDPYGAQVFAGTQLLGTTPLLAEALPEGIHEITLRREGHLDTTFRMDTDSTRRIEVRLTPSGTLEIDPENGVELLLNRGHLSLTRKAQGPIPLACGNWRIRTVHPDWRPLDTSVALLPGKTTRLGMQRLWARLSIDVRQGPTMTWLDGKPLGNTPHLLEEVVPGAHRLVLRAPGYREVERTLRLSPGEALLLKLDLDSLEGRSKPVRPNGFEEE